MEILQVIPYFSWVYGGPVRVVYEVSNELAKRGHNVHIYTTDVSNNGYLNENEKIEMADGVTLKYFHCNSSTMANKLKLHFSNEMLSEIKKTLNNFDIIHSREWRGVPNFYIWYYAKKYGVPYILQAHGSTPLTYRNQVDSLTFPKFVYDKIIGKKIVKDASKVIALNKKEFNQYLAAGVDVRKIGMIPNGINFSEFEDLPVKGKFRERYGINQNQKIILFLGRLNKIKGIEILIKSFKTVLNDLTNVKLIISGPDDGMLFSLQNLVKNLKIGDKVIFTGPLYSNEKIMAYLDSDIYVLPSLYETFPNTVLSRWHVEHL